MESSYRSACLRIYSDNESKYEGCRPDVFVATQRCDHFQAQFSNSLPR